MAKTTTTVGDQLPATLKANYSSKVLKLPLEKAQAIQQGGAPRPKGFTQQHADELNDIYQKSVQAATAQTGSSDPGGPYWGNNQ